MQSQDAAQFTHHTGSALPRNPVAPGPTQETGVGLSATAEPSSSRASAALTV